MNLCLKSAKILISDSADKFAMLAAETIVKRLDRAPGSLHLISLSGGSTPFPVYRLLPELLTKAGLKQSCYWIQTDERLVSVDHERSNQKAIRESLFADGRLPESHFFPVPTAEQPQEAHLVSEAYLSQLQKLPVELRPPAPIDMVILGVGNDGHTASLFPETEWQKDDKRGFMLVKPKSQPEARISLTSQRIIAAQDLVFLVSGSAKQQIIESIFLDPANACPTAVIARQRPTTWIFDNSAISEHLRKSL